MNFKPCRKSCMSVVILYCYAFNTLCVESYKNIREDNVLQESRIHGLGYSSCSRKIDCSAHC